MGVVGCNLEDATVHGGQLLPVEEQVARIREVLEVAKDEGVPDFIVNARCDALLSGGIIEECIRRGKEYLNAGATTIFVWGATRGLRDDEIRSLVDALNGRLTVKLGEGKGKLSMKELAQMGVARISMGPAIWREQEKAAERRINEILSDAAAWIF